MERFDPLTLGVRLSAHMLTTERLTDYLNDYLKKALTKVQFGPLFAGWTKGYYSWRGLRYFMFEYENELLNKSKTKREKLVWEEFISEDYDHDYKTVEHIYPQKVVEDCWKRSFNQYSIAERNILKNSIGNLVPLSKPKNSSLQNKCFDEKKGSREQKVGYAYGCYSEIEVSQEADWTPHQILDRGIMLLEFMERRWQFSLGTKQDKINALKLGFVRPK
jgi:hypothetical protein